LGEGKPFMKRLSLSSVLTGLMLTTPILCFSAPSEWVQWEVSSGGNGHWYKPVPGFPGITWTFANELAQAEGGHLATITSAEENAFVFSLVANDPQYWNFCCNYSGAALGGLQREGAPEPAGGWHWVTGEPWTYSNWYPGQPNNRPEAEIPEERLHFFFPDGQWNDLGKLDSNLGGYVIERDTRVVAELPATRPFQTLHPEPADLIAIEENRPQFGAVVAGRNDTALVGMPTFSCCGRVAVFNRPDRVWLRAGNLPCKDGGGCSFVHSIVLRGNIAVVGAQDVVLVFKRGTDGIWRFKQRIDPPEASSAIQFGTAQSVRYEHPFITAASYHADFAPSALYVFEISSAGKLLNTTRLAASDGAPGDGFGLTAYMALPRIVVSGGGAAYVFNRTSTGWVQRQKLRLPGGDFGFNVAIDDGMILVGAPSNRRAGGPALSFQRGGVVHAFEQQNGVWTLSATIQPSIDEYSRYTEFGQNIVMFGKRVVIGASETAVDGIIAFEYERTAQGLKATSIVRGGGDGGFGARFALFNNNLMLGVPTGLDGSNIGHVRIFNLSNTPVH
jgi:hypothetical protein